ncbi:methionine aminopeptidase [Ammoniphilus sp. 3BR4]|uniref:methionine aminopeptidase n=1 Tax=Ammoniphilus sp. 3BR4 TaxID=3158265 RepID=UPI0034677A0B
MGLFQLLSDWKEANYQKKVTEMQSQGKCPDCLGRGYNPVILSGYYYMSSLDCPGCNGSGLFSDWTQAE